MAWTTAEDDYIRKVYPLKGVAGVMEGILRTRASIVKRAGQLGVKCETMLSGRPSTKPPAEPAKPMPVNPRPRPPALSTSPDDWQPPTTSMKTLDELRNRGDGMHRVIRNRPHYCPDNMRQGYEGMRT